MLANRQQLESLAPVGNISCHGGCISVALLKLVLCKIGRLRPAYSHTPLGATESDDGPKGGVEVQILLRLSICEYSWLWLEHRRMQESWKSCNEFATDRKTYAHDRISSTYLHLLRAEFEGEATRQTLLQPKKNRT